MLEKAGEPARKPPFKAGKTWIWRSETVESRWKMAEKALKNLWIFGALKECKDPEMYERKK